MCAKSLQLHLILCDPMDHSLPGSSVPEILQARILEWVAVPSSRGSSQSRDWIHVSCFLQWEAGSLLVPPGKPEWRPEMLFAHSTMYTPALHRKNYSASNGHLDEVKKLCPPWTYTERRDHVQKKNIFCLWITGSGQRNRTLLKWSLERHAYLKYCLLVIVWMFDLVTLTI